MKEVKEFKVGDKVRVIDTRYKGVVIKDIEMPDGYYYSVTLDVGTTHGFYQHQLISLTPQTDKG